MQMLSETGRDNISIQRIFLFNGSYFRAKNYLFLKKVLIVKNEMDLDITYGCVCNLWMSCYIGY